MTPVPGTTRDALEESILIEGMLFRLTDTAGLRESSDEVEQMGVARTRSAVTKADIVLHVMDAGISSSVKDHLERMSVHKEGQYFLPVLNKCDVLASWPEQLEEYQEAGRSHTVVAVSAKAGKGLEQLRTALATLVMGDGAFGEEDVCITNQRHKECLRKLEGILDSGIASLKSGASQEYVAFDITRGRISPL